jgi:hypothetical protein
MVLSGSTDWQRASGFDPRRVACYPWPSRRECIIPKSPLMDVVHSIDPLYALSGFCVARWSE